jgi:hypothetical protein
MTETEKKDVSLKVEDLPVVKFDDHSMGEDSK